MTRPYARTTAHNLTNGAVSFWYDQIGLPTPGAALPGDTDCDVCIVGGGLTGLWTAYYLAKAQPGLRIVVLEAEFAGFGASGRNGGWLSAELAGNRDRYARTGGRDGVRELTDAMVEAVDEVIAVCAQEGIDADIVKGGVVYAARTQP
ncbi:MAG: NAD(P)/FAD-dependent oxidoreductase, partial [Nocardioidaceae bacterium]